MATSKRSNRPQVWRASASLVLACVVGAMALIPLKAAANADAAVCPALEPLELPDPVPDGCEPPHPTAYTECFDDVARCAKCGLHEFEVLQEFLHQNVPDDEAVLAFDHLRKVWVGGRWNSKDKKLVLNDRKLDFDVNCVPTLSIRSDENLRILVFNSNPLLYSLEAKQIEEYDPEALAQLQELALLFGRGLTTVLKASQQVVSQVENTKELRGKAIQALTRAEETDFLGELTKSLAWRGSQLEEDSLKLNTSLRPLLGAMGPSELAASQVRSIMRDLEGQIEPDWLVQQVEGVKKSASTIDKAAAGVVATRAEISPGSCTTSYEAAADAITHWLRGKPAKPTERVSAFLDNLDLMKNTAALRLDGCNENPTDWQPSSSYKAGDEVGAPKAALVFRAVKLEEDTEWSGGKSGEYSPSWPETLGATVRDNEVVWQAVSEEKGQKPDWEADKTYAKGGLVKGSTEKIDFRAGKWKVDDSWQGGTSAAKAPAWPTVGGATVPDNDITWRAAKFLEVRGFLALAKFLEDEDPPPGQINPDVIKSLTNLQRLSASYVAMASSFAGTLQLASDLSAKSAAASKLMGSIEALRERELKVIDCATVECPSAWHNLSTGVLVVLGGDPRLKWDKGQKRGFTVQVDASAPFADQIPKRREEKVESEVKLQHSWFDRTGVGVAITQTGLTSPVFGAVSVPCEDGDTAASCNPPAPEAGMDSVDPSTLSKMVIAQTDEQTRSGELALLLSYRLTPTGPKKKKFGFGVEAGFGLSSHFAGFAGPVAYLGRYVRLGAGITCQQVKELSGGQQLGSVVSSSEEIITRDTFETDYYISLTFALDSLPIFKGGSE